MSTFDTLFFSVFQHYKTRFKHKANTIASLYISLLQIALILLLGAFFAEFFEQMHVNTISSWKAWTLFSITCVIIYFRNWIAYGGKKRKVLNAKRNKSSSSLISIWKLWLLLMACFGLALAIIMV